MFKMHSLFLPIPRGWSSFIRRGVRLLNTTCFMWCYAYVSICQKRKLRLCCIHTSRPFDFKSFHGQIRFAFCVGGTFLFSSFWWFTLFSRWQQSPNKRRGAVSVRVIYLPRWLKIQNYLTFPSFFNLGCSHTYIWSCRKDWSWLAVPVFV